MSNIYVLTFANEFYSDMVEMLFQSVRIQRKDIKFILAHHIKMNLEKPFLNDVIKIRQDGPFGEFPGWNHIDTKIKCYRHICGMDGIDDDDYIVDMDADTCVVNAELFDRFKGDICGSYCIGESEGYNDTRAGKTFHWASGACIAIRVHILKKIIALNPKEIDDIRHYIQWGMNGCHMWDVAICYMASLFTDNIQDIKYLAFDEKAICGEFGEGEYLMHFNAPFREFLGHPVKNKQDIPRLLKELKIFPFKN